jgi:hypothetical protein
VTTVENAVEIAEIYFIGASIDGERNSLARHPRSRAHREWDRLLLRDANSQDGAPDKLAHTHHIKLDAIIEML